MTSPEKPKPPLLFLSHATEDKDAIARPLKEALSTRYRVWWDEDVLKAGDSLFLRISAGLAECDFGVVVLSSAYLQKKWTQAEVAGLFALETTTRKVLLPVWHNVTREQVAAFSPILADRWAPLTSKGLDHVVDSVTASVEAASKQQEISSRPTIASKILAADANARKKAYSDGVLRSPEGARTTRERFDELLQAVTTIAETVTAQASLVKFRCERKPDNFNGGHILFVYTMPLLILVLAMKELYSNDATSSVLSVKVLKRPPMHLEFREAPSTLDEQEFRPWFEEDGSIRWRGHRAMLTTPEVAERAMEMLHTARERETAE